MLMLPIQMMITLEFKELYTCSVVLFRDLKVHEVYFYSVKIPNLIHKRYFTCIRSAPVRI